VAFLGAFLFIRTSARLMRSPKVPWWPGSVTTGDLHIHHLVWGIVLMMVAGFISLNPIDSPWHEIVAVLFGIGAGLTLDEFALWLRLQDVYWAEEGRSSFDAVVVAAVLAGLIVLGIAPFDLSHDAASVESLIAVVFIDVLLATAAIVKGKPMMGLIGLFIPVVSLVATVRLASPGSPWARWRYRPGSKKLARSEARWRRIKARRKRVVDAILGAPGTPGVIEDNRAR